MIEEEKDKHRPYSRKAHRKTSYAGASETLAFQPSRKGLDTVEGDSSGGMDAGRCCAQPGPGAATRPPSQHNASLASPRGQGQVTSGQGPHWRHALDSRGGHGAAQRLPSRSGGALAGAIGRDMYQVPVTMTQNDPGWRMGPSHRDPYPCLQNSHPQVSHYSGMHSQGHGDSAMGLSASLHRGWGACGSLASVCELDGRPGTRGGGPGFDMEGRPTTRSTQRPPSRAQLGMQFLPPGQRLPALLPPSVGPPLGTACGSLAPSMSWYMSPQAPQMGALTLPPPLVGYLGHSTMDGGRAGLMSRGATQLPPGATHPHGLVPSASIRASSSRGCARLRPQLSHCDGLATPPTAANASVCRPGADALGDSSLLSATWSSSTPEQAGLRRPQAGLVPAGLGPGGAALGLGNAAASRALLHDCQKLAGRPAAVSPLAHRGDRPVPPLCALSDDDAAAHTDSDDLVGGANAVVDQDDARERARDRPRSSRSSTRSTGTGAGVSCKGPSEGAPGSGAVAGGPGSGSRRQRSASKRAALALGSLEQPLPGGTVMEASAGRTPWVPSPSAAQGAPRRQRASSPTSTRSSGPPRSGQGACAPPVRLSVDISGIYSPAGSSLSSGTPSPGSSRLTPHYAPWGAPTGPTGPSPCGSPGQPAHSTMHWLQPVREEE